MPAWDNGHAHRWVYFGGMASCSLCAARLEPGGAVKAPTQSSRQHREMSIVAKRNK